MIHTFIRIRLLLSLALLTNISYSSQEAQKQDSKTEKTKSEKEIKDITYFSPGAALLRNLFEFDQCHVSYNSESARELKKYENRSCQDALEHLSKEDSQSRITTLTICKSPSFLPFFTRCLKLHKLNGYPSFTSREAFSLVQVMQQTAEQED